MEADARIISIFQLFPFARILKILSNPGVREMTNLSSLNQRALTRDKPDGPMWENSTNLQSDVRRTRGLRQLRKQLFGSEVFSGPPWDILLHLFEAHVYQHRCSIGNVCDGADLPCTTGLRWLDKLRLKGLVRLSDDQFDKRRRYVELTDAGVALMTKYFGGVAPHLIAA
jgi:DNA-binding MarR family transcriptional regulator